MKPLSSLVNWPINTFLLLEIFFENRIDRIFLSSRKKRHGSERSIRIYRFAAWISRYLYFRIPGIYVYTYIPSLTVSAFHLVLLVVETKWKANLYYWRELVSIKEWINVDWNGIKKRVGLCTLEPERERERERECTWWWCISTTFMYTYRGGGRREL